jgi:hypothetical protein
MLPLKAMFPWEPAALPSADITKKKIPGPGYTFTIPVPGRGRIRRSKTGFNQRAAVYPLEIFGRRGNTFFMDIGQVVYIMSRLVLGALASFFAIMLWSKTRDVAWMLMVIGTIAAYIEIVYSILELLGITEGDSLVIGSIPVASIVLPCLPMIFFISAFVVMVFRKYRYK